MSEQVAARSDQAADSDLDVHFDRLVNELADEFAATHDRAMIEAMVTQVRTELAGQAKVHSFLPVLASKHVRRRLKHPSTAQTPRE